MKKLILLVTLFNCSILFAQKFSIISDNGDIFNLDASHTLKIKVEGYESSKITATASLPGIMRGEDGKYTVNLAFGHLSQRNVGESVRIDVFVEKEDGNYMVGGKAFYIARKNDFEMGLGTLRAGDYISLSQFDAIERMGIAFDDAWTEKMGKGYKVFSYSCMLVPERGEAEAFLSSNEKVSQAIKANVKKMGVGCRVIFDDIVLKNENGETKRGSRIFLTISEKRGTYLYPFAEKDQYTIDELLNIQSLTAQAGSDSPMAGAVYQITAYDLLLVLKAGHAESFNIRSNQFSEGIKKNIKEKMKPGDKILIDNITYIKHDGTYGICPPEAIFIIN